MADNRCDACNGTGYTNYNYFTDLDDLKVCTTCEGVGSIPVYDEEKKT